MKSGTPPNSFECFSINQREKVSSTSLEQLSPHKLPYFIFIIILQGFSLIGSVLYRVPQGSLIKRSFWSSSSVGPSVIFQCISDAERKGKSDMMYMGKLYKVILMLLKNVISSTHSIFPFHPGLKTSLFFKCALCCLSYVRFI